MSLGNRMRENNVLVGTFQKTPSHQIIEILAHSGLDFVILDAEHGAFDNASLDVCISVARGVGLPVLVRIAGINRSAMQTALDCGADGVVVPHVSCQEQAEDVAQWARFGLDGRGFAGSTRWADFGTRSMASLLARSRDDTVVIVQIEDPEGLSNAEAIAGVAGIDGLFIGPADLAVSLGLDTMTDPQLKSAFDTVGRAAHKHGRRCLTFVPECNKMRALTDAGIDMFVVGSDQSLLLMQAQEIGCSTRSLMEAGESGDI